MNMDAIRDQALIPEMWPIRVAKYFDVIGARTWRDVERLSDLAILSHKGMAGRSA